MSPRKPETVPSTEPDSTIPSRLDRQAIRRTDPAWIESSTRGPNSRLLVVRGQAVLLVSDTATQPRFLSGKGWSELGAPLTDLVFLGISEGLSFFALDVTEAPPEIHERLALFGTFASMRKLSPSLPQATWEMIAQACSLSRWNRTARFCSVCGAPMVPRDAGYVRICSNEDCAATEFPRIDPAIIVRVMSADRCLLARQSKFAPGLRSVIAGFVEPGEALEAAVAREVREEAGLDVRGIAYAGSQPWPFPRALMLGFVANAVEPRICIDDREIEAADWYTRDRVRRELSAGTLSLPSTRSIARFLIDDWLDEKGLAVP